MHYRALFVGGPLDGREKALAVDARCITIPGDPQVRYTLLFAFGKEPKTLIYSLWDVTETLNRIWSRYTTEHDTATP